MREGAALQGLTPLAMNRRPSGAESNAGGRRALQGSTPLAIDRRPSEANTVPYLC